MNKSIKAPFPVEFVSWKPQATNQEKTRALAVPYVDLRPYEDRLNEVCDDWSNDVQIHLDGNKIACTVTVMLDGVSRTNVGEAPMSDENAATIAYAQAFKRACSSFGLGRYLYDLPTRWVDYDANKKKITDGALAQLRREYEKFLDGTGSDEAEEPIRKQEWPTRPFDAEILKQVMDKKVKTYKGKGKEPSEKQLDFVRSSLGKLKLSDPERHTVMLYLFGVESTGNLTAAQCSALIDWIAAKAPDWEPSQDAKVEARAVIKQYQREQGQAEMGL